MIRDINLLLGPPCKFGIDVRRPLVACVDLMLV